MSFTSQVVRIGEGWEGTAKVEEDAALVYAIRDQYEATAPGAEGSSDDAKELFPDTYVDMARNANQELEIVEEEEQNKWFFWRKKKNKKKKFYN
ncbi:MAG: hypothetical protein S4CHLAM6_07240 [Chlamydiae bacterium]|nr:hypothetical protein [Chlamydiota bacterium]